MANDANNVQYDPYGCAVYAFTSDEQVERFDMRLLSLPAGKQSVYHDSYPGNDLEREERFRRGVRHAFAELTYENALDLDMFFALKRSKAKTEANLHFADTGERPRERQFEIDFWRGAQHAASRVVDAVLGLSRDVWGFSPYEHREVVSFYIEEIKKIEIPEPNQSSERFEIPSEVSRVPQSVWHRIVAIKPELPEKIARHNHRMIKQALKKPNEQKLADIIAQRFAYFLGEEQA